MIYLDSSVALAAIMIEPRRPQATFWSQRIASSRLLQFDVWNRMHAYGASTYRRVRADDFPAKVGFVEMSIQTPARALAPFPIPVRTLDGLQLATEVRLRDAGEKVELASYDNRLLVAAAALGIPAATL